MGEKTLILIPVVDENGFWVASGYQEMWQAFYLGDKQNGFRGSQSLLEGLFQPFTNKIVCLKSPQAAYSLGYGQEFIHRLPLAVGDKVMVYQDPLTEQMPEGVATLVKRVSRDSSPVNWGKEVIERWMVKFEGETRKVERRILTSWT